MIQDALLPSRGTMLKVAALVPFLAFLVLTSAYGAMSGTEVFQKCSPAVVCVLAREQQGQTVNLGSGFIVSQDGNVVTSLHVVKGKQGLSVTLPNNATLSVQGILATDEASDLALIQTNGRGLPTLPLGDDSIPAVGAKVFAIGNPEGLMNSLSEGIVSGVRNLENGMSVIQTTAPISPGSSGGPILNADGKVVGVVTAYLVRGQNLNFGVPVERIRKLLAKKGALLRDSSPTSVERKWDPIADYRTPYPGLAFSTVDECDAALSIDPNNAQAYYCRAFLARNGFGADRSKVIADLSKAVELNPDMVQAYFERARQYLNTWSGTEAALKLSRAITDYTKVVALDPTCAQAYLEREYAYLASNITNKPDRLERAAADCDKVCELDSKKSLQALSIRAEGYERAGQYDLAIADYTKLVELDPQDVFRIELEKNGVRSLGGYSIFEIDKYNFSPLSKRAFCYREKKEYKRSIDDYDKALLLHPTYKFLLGHRGYTYYEEGNYDAAIADFTAAGDYAGRAKARVRKGDHDAALSDYDRAIAEKLKLKDSDQVLVTLYVLRGDVCMRQKDYGAAISDYSKALSRDQFKFYLFDCILKRARAYMLKGDSALADEDLRRALTECEARLSRHDAGLNGHESGPNDGGRAKEGSGLVFFRLDERSQGYIRMSKADIRQYLSGDNPKAHFFKLDNKNKDYSSVTDTEIREYVQEKTSKEAEPTIVTVSKRLPNSRPGDDPRIIFRARAEIWLLKKDYDKAWADVKRCRDVGAEVDKDFLEELCQASGRNEPPS